MGRMRFRVFPPQRITEEMIEQVYLSGIDRASWPDAGVSKGDELVLDRSVSDSANLHMPWAVEGHGPLTLVSGSLIERPEPYLLPLELARGTIVEVRNQLAEWQRSACRCPRRSRQTGRRRSSGFPGRRSARTTRPPRPAMPKQALRAALEAGDLLAAAYTEQALAARRRNGGKRPGLLGAELGTACWTTALAAVSPHVQRGRRSRSLAGRGNHRGRFLLEHQRPADPVVPGEGLKVLAGPLLPFDPRACPTGSRCSRTISTACCDFVSAFVRAAVARYRGKVDYWICAGRINAADVLALSEQERLRLVARIIELVRALDRETPVLVSFDQPWGEYLRQQGLRLPSAALRRYAGSRGPGLGRT